MPILGVCLGHQSIGIALRSGNLAPLPFMEGCTDYHNGSDLYSQLAFTDASRRYHSLIVSHENFS